MPELQDLEVSFMPWADLSQAVQVGPVTFWPFSKLATEKITNTELREHLRRYFASYVDHEGRPVDSVVVCSHGVADFRPLSSEERQQLTASADALVFSCIAPNAVNAVCANNWSIGPPSSDRYQLFTQNLRLGSDHLAIEAGSSITGGLKIGEVKFPRPWCMGGWSATPDVELVSGIDCMFTNAHPQQEVQRVRRSLEWFRLAHTETHQVSDLSKIVMMATAFEIVLDLPRKDKTRLFAERVHRTCSSARVIQETRVVDGRSFTNSLPAWWARDFYDLRSTVVHGSIPTREQLGYTPPGRSWLNHLIVADLVFWEIIKRRLYNLGCIGADLKACAAQWDANAGPDSFDRAEPVLVAWLLGFSDVHRSLGWERKLEREQDED